MHYGRNCYQYRVVTQRSTGTCYRGNNHEVTPRVPLPIPRTSYEHHGRLTKCFTHRKGVLCLKNIRFFVLDEADALLAGGTLNAIHTIKQKIPKHGSIVAQKFGRVQVRVSFPKSGDTVLPKLVTVQTEAGDCLSIHRPIHAQYVTDTFRVTIADAFVFGDVAVAKGPRARDGALRQERGLG